MRVEALRKTLIMTALKKSNKNSRKEATKSKRDTIKIRSTSKRKEKIKVIKEQNNSQSLKKDSFVKIPKTLDDKYLVKSSLLLKPEEISDAFATSEGKELYKKSTEASQMITLNLVQEKMNEFRRLEQENNETEFEKSLKSSEEAKEEEQINNKESVENKIEALNTPNLLFPCPFRFEKASKMSSNDPFSDSDESVNLEELTDFNKIMEKHLKESMKKEFHEKFHSINQIQNKEIDKKLKAMAKNRNVGQLKYLMKKKVNNFKDNIDQIKIKLESLDENLKQDSNQHFMGKNNKAIPSEKDRADGFFLSKSSRKSKSIPHRLSILKSGNNKNDLVTDEKNMKDAFSRFKKKYNVSSDQDVYKIISKIQNKNVEDKFSKFVTYFKQNAKTKHRINFAHQMKDPFKMEDEMLDEISKFVVSQDFSKFYKKYIRNNNSSRSPNRFNRKPKNVEVRRTKSKRTEK